MARAYNSSDDDGDRSHRLRRRESSTNSSDSDRYIRGRERRIEREKRSRLDSSDSPPVRERRVLGRVEREEKSRLDSLDSSPVRERRVTGKVEREEKSRLDSSDSPPVREGKVLGRGEREEKNRLDSPESLPVRERRVSGRVEREEKSRIDSSDSDGEKHRNRRGREREEPGKEEREKGRSDYDNEKLKRKEMGKVEREEIDYSSPENIERGESGMMKGEKGIDGSSSLGRERKESGIREREKHVEDSRDSDREKMKRDRNGRGRGRKGSGKEEREKSVEGSSDWDRQKSKRDRNGHGRKRRERYDRDRKGDRDRKERREKDYSDEDGEIIATETRKERDRERREESSHEKNDLVQKKQSLPQLGDVNADVAIGRTGGVYIPPFKLARMIKEVDDKSSVDYQRLTWDALRKSINGLVNKVNAMNIKNIVPELFSENLVRGRGLFCRSCMKSQMASPAFSDVFAALAAVVNTKFPQIGYLLLKRIVLQLKRAYKRNDKPQLLAAVKFIAHLVNQQLVHELIALELLTLLLEKPTDDSVEVAVGFVTECGSILQDLCPRGLHGIFESFRGILHEGEIDKRVQFLIEGLFAIRKAKFKGHPAVRPELDLVEQEDQLTHEISLAEDEDLDPETILDIFRPDPDFLKNEKIYEDHKKNILGDDSEDKSDSDAGSDDKDDEDDDEDEEEEEERMKIQDETETNLVNLRRTIYLTIMSSVDFEEAGHKLLKIKLEPGQEMELCIMLLECCSQERTYLRYYGLLGQRFCMINRIHQENFEKSFVQQYSMIHRLETNKLRNVAKFFAHLLGTNALPWHVLAYIRLTEEDTTSSSRIFIKILFQELSEHLGIRLLNERLNDPTMQESFESIFPRDNPKNTRFAINFFTSIGLGGITENLREYLKNMPRLIMQQQKPASDSDDESSDGSSSSDSDSSSSESESSSSSEDERERKRKRRK